MSTPAERNAASGGAAGLVEAVRSAGERVEWLAALWELAEGVDSRSANPSLLAVVRFAGRLGDHPAAAELGRARARAGRDALIKEVVRHAHGSAASPLGDQLRELAGRADELLGVGASAMMADARNEVGRRVDAIAGRLDPAGDLAEVCGERVGLELALAPSLFLPPPQAGRHGALVRRGAGFVAHLHFGFPLGGDPRAFGIDRMWLLGGAWHYAIDVYLEPRWPTVAARLELEPALGEAVAGAMERSGSEHATWTAAVRAHVGLTLKCLLARRRGLPDDIHRAFARTAGLCLFPWFEEWMTGGVAGGAAIDDLLVALPSATAADRSSWESLARRVELPPTVNLALIAPAARRAALVIPDSWSDDDASAALAGWRLLPIPVVRHTAWCGAGSREAPVIAVGPPGENPLVREVLHQRGLSLEATGAAHPAIVALSAAGFSAAPWCVALAVEEPGTAALLTMEMVLRETSSHIVFDGARMVHSERVPLGHLTSRTPAVAASGGG